MKKRQNASQGATALRSTISAVLIAISVILLASSFKAAPPASGLSAAIVLPFEGDHGTESGNWTLTGSLNTARVDHTATLLPNGKVLVTGGFSYSPVYVNLSSAELYDPTSGTWMVTGSLNTARNAHTATLLPSGKVLVAGGFSSDPSPYSSSAELYDPTSGAWMATGSLNTARTYHTATLLPGGKVLVTGGFGYYPPGMTVSDAELYDSASETWTTTASLNTTRVYHTATLLPNGKVLVTGGVSGVYLSPGLTSAELYDPVNGSWTFTGSLNIGRFDHTATLLPNGKVLVAGGYSQTIVPSILASAELYDPVSGIWTVTGSLNVARGQYTATLRPDGKVLVAGGYNGDGSAGSSSAELYDPASGSWALTGSLNNARDLHTATLLPNGKVLAAGGVGTVGGSTVYFRSAELYETEGKSCIICHKHTLTLSLECGSLEYQRHLDHGDTVGACPHSKQPSDQTDSLGQD